MSDPVCSHPNRVLMGEAREWCHNCGAAFYAGEWTVPLECSVLHKRVRWAESLLADIIDVQRHTCDHKGIGRPGCAVCDPRLQPYLCVGDARPLPPPPEGAEYLTPDQIAKYMDATEHLLKVVGVPFSGKASYKCTCGWVCFGEYPDIEFARHVAEMRARR